MPFADVPRMSKGCLRTKFGVQPRLEDHSPTRRHGSVGYICPHRLQTHDGSWVFGVIVSRRSGSLVAGMRCAPVKTNLSETRKKQATDEAATGALVRVAYGHSEYGWNGRADC